LINKPYSIERFRFLYGGTMGQKSYLKVDGIRGSSSDLGHVGDLEINSFSYTYTGKSRSEQVKVTVQMELEGSFAFFYDKMMNNQKLKDATLTVEIRNQFNQLFQTYKAEMKGLKVTEVRSVTPKFNDRRNPLSSIQTVAFLVDTVQFPMAVPPGELTDQWKDS